MKDTSGEIGGKLSWLEQKECVIADIWKADDINIRTKEEDMCFLVWSTKNSVWPGMWTV